MVFQNLFTVSKGQPITYKGRELKMVDRVGLPKTTVRLSVSFVATDSQWKQGIVLQTKGIFDVNGQNIPNKIVFWEDTAPKEIELSVNSKDGELLVYNVRRTGDGTVHYWHNGGAMHVEMGEGCRNYHCNDGDPDDDLNDLVFKLTFE